MTEKAKIVNGQLVVPNNPVVPFIEGDGIGKDISLPSHSVVDAAVSSAYGGSKKIVWKEVLAGEKAYHQLGTYLPNETIEAFKDHLIGIKGPLQTPVGGGIRSLNVALRQSLDLFVCLRPVRWFKGVPSPVRFPSLVDMHIFRENTEDIYAGIEWVYGTESAKKITNFLLEEMKVKSIRFPETVSIGIKPVSKEGTERLVRAAIQYAIKYKKPSVTLVHKGNIMKFTEGQFKQWGYELAEAEFGDYTFTWKEYDRIAEKEGKDAADAAQESALKSGKILVKDVIADAFLQQILTRPKEYSVIATLNLNGDYISDALAAIVGGIGIAPGANINYVTGHAIFEATHGTAPKYAGLDKVNPGSVILSGVMMLEYLGWTEAGEVIVNAIQSSILKKTVTYDFARLMEGAKKVSCSGFGDAIISNM